nr:VCBS repeat-containing protein [candidate division Zixibacteria bacterium]
MTFKIGKLESTLILKVLLVCLLPGSIVLGADQDFFDIYTLEIEGEIQNYLTGDFNADNLMDIALIYSPLNDPGTRYIGLFLQKRPAGFNTNADYLTAMAPGVAQLDVADMDNDGRDEIFLMNGDGVSVVSFSVESGFSGPVKIIRQNTVYSVPIFHDIIADRFIFELNSAPGLEFILPGPRGYVIYERGDNGEYQVLTQLSVPLCGTTPVRTIKEFTSHRNSDWNIQLAEINVFDGNLDNHPDLYFLWDRKVCVFFQDATGNFSQTPDVERIFCSDADRGYIQSRIIDYNRDGRLDIAVAYVGGGITNTESRIRFYVADQKGIIETNYRKEITLSDSHCNFLIGDFNGDGVSEMALAAIELGALAATKMFLMKNADLHLLVFPFDSGLPRDEPDRRMKYEFRFNFDDPQPIVEVSLDWSDDYNGDNLHDLVFSDGNGNLKFYWGREKEYLSKKPDLEISLDHPLEIHPIHLNKGTMSDIIVEHNLSGRLDRLTVLKNRNNIN